MHRRSVFVLLLGLVSLMADAAGAQSARKRPPEETQYDRAQRLLRKAMAADGLGQSITIVEPRLERGTGVIERRTLEPPTWAHGELGGNYVAPLGDDTVTATWTPNGTDVGRLVIEGWFNRQQCRFEGGIAADRVTVTGTGVCEGVPTPFRAVINRPRD